jgi:hypothetical protein
VYALGRVEPRFPSLAIEKEFAQAVGRAETIGLTERQALHRVLTDKTNAYLVRQLCWVFTIEGLETYILVARDSSGRDMLVETLRSTPVVGDLDLVIGLKGPIAPVEYCNGLSASVVFFDQIYSFDRESLLKAIPRPEKIAAREFSAASTELFDRILMMADNAGATDEHRALNYLAVRYPGVYTTVLAAYSRDLSLTEIRTRPSSIGELRTIVDVIFTFTNRSTGVPEKFLVRVDVTEEFPFLVSRMTPYYGCC